MMYPVGWTTDGAGDVTEFRAPLGTTVEHTGVGEYTIQTSTEFPGLGNRWADLLGSSVSRAGVVTFPGGFPQRMVVTFNADMGFDERAGVTFIGPVSKYPTNYDGEFGGVHEDLVSRDVHNYSNYPHFSPLRDSCFIPFRFEVGAVSVIEPDAAGTALPAGMRASFAGSGEWALYIGAFPQAGIVGAAQGSDGADYRFIDVDGPAGTVTINRVGGAPAAGTIVQGFILATTQSVR